MNPDTVWRTSLAALLILSSVAATAHAIDLPTGFENQEILTGLDEPSGIRFSPDGRLFIAERITGDLHVATSDASSSDWTLEAEPFYSFDTPHDGSGVPLRHRSSGLRDFVFDPDFATNGHLYAIYMKHDPRHNRVVRITASAGDPNLADPTSELLLIDLPFNDSESSGSHNGCGMTFGPAGHLYIATGDGWNGGDLVQSLTSFTGKIFRIAADGSIPIDNPFFSETTGPYRAIFAIGLRNPFSMSQHPTTGQVIVNECNGPTKANLFIVEPGANMGHQGFGSLGTPVTAWANAAVAGTKLVTGGAWYPAGGSFGPEYDGRYFTSLWGGNGDAVGDMTTVAAIDNPTVDSFATNVGFGDCAVGLDLKPVTVQFGPAGDLYYALTNYESECGSVHCIRFTGEGIVETPLATPAGGWSAAPLAVALTTATAGAEIRFTTDGTAPSESSALYATPIPVVATTTVRARAFLSGSGASGIIDATFVIGDLLTSPTVSEPLVPGLRYELITGGYGTIPPFDSLTPDDAGTTPRFALDPSPASTNYGLKFAGYLDITSAGVYEFTIESDDGARLWVGDVLIVDHDHIGLSTKSGSVGLGAGLHPIALEYFQADGDATLNVTYSGPGLPSGPIPDASLSRVQNLPPMTDAGTDTTAGLFELVELNGSLSDDPDSDELALTWLWEQTSGPSATLLGDDDAVTWFVPDSPGLYVFRLTVSDDESSDSDEVTVTVTDQIAFDLAAGLVAHWPLDENSGTVAADATTAHDGTLVNGPVWSPAAGVVSGALEFDGVDDRVALSTIELGGPAMTIAFWFRADDFDQMDGRFISKAAGVQPDDHTWMVSTINDTGLRFRLRTGGTTTTLASATGTIATDTWTHVVARYDGQSMQVYRDAELIAETGKSGPIDVDPTRPVALGDQPQGTRPFDGMLDDVRIYDRALLLVEIVALASCGQSGPDCNGNGLADACDVALGFSLDVDLDGVPDECSPMEFIRGDVNADTSLHLSDPVLLLDYLFLGSAPDPVCLATADVDDDGAVQISDALLLLEYLFSSGPPPTAPFPECGVGSIGGVDCGTYVCP